MLIDILKKFKNLRNHHAHHAHHLHHSPRQFFILFLSLFSLSSHAQYFQQQVNHRIDVTLNDTENTLDGFEKITYINNSPDTLNFIWFHLWPNAYKNDQTAFSEQLLQKNRTDFYFSGRDDRGYINRLDFKADGITATVQDHPQHIDIVKLVLPAALAPGDSTVISTGFHVKLPNAFSRSGHNKQSYLATQWYPKPAVYDKSGWHEMPYLDQGEFYSEFGNYDVRITVPQNYVVAATGELQDNAELQWLKDRKNFSFKPAPVATPRKLSTPVKQPVIDPFPPSSKETKSLQYLQQNVHDFAWFADKRFVVQTDTASLPSGRVINLFTYFLPSHARLWKNSMLSLRDAIQTRAAWIGEYPYNIVSAVDAQMGFAGGMEYPTITAISQIKSERSLDETIAHEVSHNWLYGILASNERSFPWMDEGMNTYYDNRYTKWKYPEAANHAREGFVQRRLPKKPDAFISNILVAAHKDQPINTESSRFTELNYAMSAFTKTGDWMQHLQSFLGTPVFDTAMHSYYRQWQFKHPSPADFKAVVETISHRNFDSLFAQLNQTGGLEKPVKKRLQFTSFFNLRETASKNYLSIAPAIGANQYDGFMIGAIIHNYQLPLKPLSFFVMPLFGTSSKKLNGMAKVSYHWYPKKAFYRIDAGVNAAMFSINSFEPALAKKLYPGFRKAAPFLRFTFKEPDALSKTERFIQLKSFIIHEDALQFKQVVSGPDTSTQVNISGATRNLFQLRFGIENSRVLYPYRAIFDLEQQTGFLRLGFTGNYFFNFANRESGVKLRVFAGKFIYTGAKTTNKQFETDRYHLNLSGPDGNEDYTYSNYFVGRNAFDGWTSQQLMIRDGGFKVRTDLLSSKVGKTDNWLLAINLATDLPKQINPLQLLPVKIPVKIFADIGTYAEAWEKNADLSHFVFDAGFQLSLFRESVNIYVPIVYSKIFRDYYRSTLGDNRFLKTITFSIDLQALSPKRLVPSIPFNPLFQ